jgi:hypothetical protein
VVSKIRVVEVPKRIPPKLPERNPRRTQAVAGAASSDDGSTASISHDETEADRDGSVSSGPDESDMTANLRDVDLSDGEEDDDDDDEIRSRLREAEEMSRQYEELKGVHGQLAGGSS